MDLSSQIKGNGVTGKLEQQFAGHCKTEFALATCNATISLLGIVKALQIQNRSIITTPLTWGSALTGFMMMGNEIHFCDVEERTLTINPARIEALITEDTAAVFTCDFLGNPCYLDEIKAICDKHGLWLIHDAAQSLGSTYKGIQSGYFADVSVFSFGHGKLFSAGEGGMITSNNENIYNNLLLTLMHPDRQHKELCIYNHFGLNARMNPMVANYIINNFEMALEKIESYKSKIKQFLNLCGINTLETYSPNYYQYAPKREDLNTIVSTTNKNDISIHEFPYKHLIYQEASWKDLITWETHTVYCPVAEKVIKEGKKVSFNNIQKRF